MSGMFSSKHSRYRKYVDEETGKVFYFDVVLKRSRWRIPPRNDENTIKTKDEDGMKSSKYSERMSRRESGTEWNIIC